MSRLEDIKNSYLEGLHRLFGTPWISMPKENLDWLIEQAEKVELEVSDWRAEVQKWQKFYKESEESHSETKELLKSIVNQNKRFREALENIYELAEYDEYDNTLEQIVSEIEKALESDEN